MNDDTADWNAALGGDGQAFARLFRLHSPRVGRHARRLVRSDADADDVVAITFFEAWRLRGRVRFVEGSVLPWILNVATNVARNQSRSARRYRQMLEKLPASKLSYQPDSSGQEIIAAIEGLPVRFRDVAVLCLVEGFGERDAASALGIRPGTVKSRLSVARAQLRSQLAPIHLEGKPNHA